MHILSPLSPKGTTGELPLKPNGNLILLSLCITVSQEIISNSPLCTFSLDLSSGLILTISNGLDHRTKW